MKKGYLLMLCLPLLLMVGCGGGSESASFDGTIKTTYTDANNTDTNNANTDYNASLGSLTIDIPADTSTTSALTDSPATGGYIRNGARAVLSQDGTSYKKIVDTVLDASGAGSITLQVEPGLAYDLELITFHTGAGIYTDVNLVMEYAHSHINGDPATLTFFDITAGQQTPVYMTLAPPVATISAPASVQGGDDYQVSLSAKDPLVADTWIVRDEEVIDATSPYCDPADVTGKYNPALNCTRDPLLDTQWYLSDVSTPGTSGENSIYLTAPIYTDEIDRNIWLHGQFFLSSHMLYNYEDYTKWTFNTTNRNTLTPLGFVVVILGGVAP